MKHKYKKKIKIASSVALSAAMIANSAGSIFAENENQIQSETQTQEYSSDNYEEITEIQEENNKEGEVTTPEDIPLTEQYFPDEGFREFVSKRFDKDSSGVLEKAELDAVTTIELRKVMTAADRIKSIKGIEYFQNLTSFISTNFYLTIEEADFSKNPKLTQLSLTNSSVKEINVSGTQVRNLTVGGNKELEVINLGENPVTNFGTFSIPTNPKLREIIGFDKIEEFYELNITSYYYEKGHYKYGQFELGMRGFDLTDKRISSLRLAPTSSVVEPFTLAWLHIGNATLMYFNKNQDSVVEMDRKGTPIEESDTDLEFRLQDKFPGIDPSRAYVIQEDGLTYDKATGTVVRTTPEVKYHYDCGQRGNDTLLLEVTLRFNPYKDIFNPQTNRITITKGSTTLPDAASTIANLADMPEDTTFVWRGGIDTSVAGEQTGSIQVTYPDGTKEKVSITVDVVDGNASDADRYTPVINTAGITTYKDETPSVEKIKEVIVNANTFPENTTYAWKNLDVSTLGETTGIATVTYPDGTEDEVEIKVNVIERNQPSNADTYEAETTQITLDQGVAPDNAQIEAGIVNKDTLPAGTKYEWQEVDTTTPGEKEAKIKVVYPDGSADENVVMPVRVKHYNEMHDPEVNETGIATAQGETPSVEKIKEAITNANTFPENTAYAWKSLDVSTVGATTGIATVTYPDRSADEVEIKVNVIDPTVGSNADIYEAETTQITLDQGVTPDNAQIEAGIVNKDTLPAGTKYEWQEVDTTTPGEKEAKIKVVYPDGSVDENVVMPVRVKHYNEMYEPEVNPAGITTTQGETPSVEKIKEAIMNANTLPEGTTYSWKNLDVSTVGATTGIATVTYPDESVDEVSIEVLVEKKEENPGTGGDENKPSNPDEPSN
ncbi:MAG: hypothetical protein K2L08_05010, partial [Erysipelotrichaceae bacterium]|nr:hypothetical protein [Erysipelotrichaceae bacterium]